MNNKKSYIEAFQEWLLKFFTGPTLLVLVITFTGVTLFYIVYYVWGVTPTIRNAVTPKSNPPLVMVSYLDVKNSIESEKVKKEIPKIDEKIPEPQKEIIDTTEVQITKMMDSLKVLLPDSIYKWERSKSYFNYDTYSYETSNPGILNYIDKLEQYSTNREHFLSGLKNLCGVLVNYQIIERKQPLLVFIEIFKNKTSDRSSIIRENDYWFEQELRNSEHDFSATEGHKAFATAKSFEVINQIIYAITLLGIFLVLLSIRKNLKKD